MGACCHGYLLARVHDATQEQTDINSFTVLEPKADGFRNYLPSGLTTSVEDMLVDRAQLLTLTAPQMMVLLGGLRAMNANYAHSPHGVLTKTPGAFDQRHFCEPTGCGHRMDPDRQ